MRRTLCRPAVRKGSSVKCVSPRGLAMLFLLAAVLTAVAIPAAWAVKTSPAITATSIAGAKLNLGKTAYKRLLGSPVRYQAAGGGDMSEPGFQQPSDYSRLVFAKRKIDVYFQAGNSAIQITTWNKAYKTKEGVGPCSSFAQLKAAYGSRLKPNPANTDPNSGTVFSYIVGRSLIFELSDQKHPGTPSSFVTAVALYDGSGAAWNKPSGPLYLASFVASAPDQVSCS